MQPVHQPARVTFKLREVRAGVALSAYGSAVAGVAVQSAIDDLEVGCILVQTDLEVEADPGHAAGLGAPFNIEDAVRCRPRYRGEYALPAGNVPCV